jgi:LacI family transcriptional regulator
LVNRHTEPITPNVVAPDDFGGAFTATEHLISLGHRRVAHIAGSDAVSTGYARRAGYLAALQRHRVAHDPALLVEGSYREPGGYEAMRRLLQLDDPPTAVFTVNDLAALGALRALREAGLRSPDHMSIIGFNDLTFATQMSPQLTTMRLPLHEMGVLAAERLMAQTLDEQSPGEPIILPVSLIVRESVGPVPTSR